MSPPPLILSLFLPLLLLLTLTRAANAAGKFDLLRPSIGISGMHMQLLNNDRVVIFDRTNAGRSNISLAAGKCLAASATNDCTAHSVEYDVASNSVRPLTVLSDTWCSSGAVTPDGNLVQTGGYQLGDHAVRTYNPKCGGNSPCDWLENNNGLTQRRWYATNHLLPDGRQIIIGGRRQFNYEFYPKKPSAEASYNLPFLVQTDDPRIENNLYPFVFLNRDGNLFIFANNRAILFNYADGTVVRHYPVIPGGDPRSYPSTGSAVLLPLRNTAEVLVCGGAPKGAFVSATNGNFVRALDTCGRIRIDDPNPQWAMETMPSARVMGDMVLLPNGNVLIINGAGSGVAGWELGRDPVKTPIVYRPDNPIGSRFEVQASSTIPRMYHSTAILLRDGRVLVAGSNPHVTYKFAGVLFPTELSLETFSPSYLESNLKSLRPHIVSPVSHSQIGYGQQVTIRFAIPPPGRRVNAKIYVTMVAPSFTTHSFSMNQRLLILSGGGNVTAIGNNEYQIRVGTPDSGNFAPSGYYLMFVVHQDVPSEGIWVQIK